MIITKEYADRLIKQGRAAVSGRTVSENGVYYVIVDRYDLQRTDHYREVEK